MKQIFTLLFLCLLSMGLYAQNGTLTGTVKDASGETLIGANILVKEISAGTVSDLDGSYTLNLPAGAHIIVVSYTGYGELEEAVNVKAGETQTLDFTLSAGTDLDVVVVSGSKKPEKLTESPATIETVFAREIEEYAGNPGELIARQKGVDYFRAGIAVPAFNIRGFNSNFNAKNLQVTDGRISSLIATGLPMGPLSHTIKEDIERVELILGPNATLYGPNAHNGLLNTITKDPRQSAGTTIAFNPGVSGDGDAYFSARLRHAQVLNDKFAFKVMGEYTAGTEFEYSDSVYIDRVGAVDSLGNAIPDGIKEGYNEFELDDEVKFLRGEVGLYYSPTKDIDVIFTTGHSSSTYLSPTNVGRNQIDDWRIGSYQLRVSGKNWFAQAYHTTSKTDSTYSIDQRTKNYYTNIDLLGMSHADAKANSFGNALFVDDSKRWNAEAQYNNTYGRLNVVVGAQYQKDIADSKGTYLLDKDGAIEVSQLGAYAHLTYNFDRGWRVLAAARADNHEVYDFNFIPKFGVLKVGDKGTFRFTYGQGIAAPTILNQYGNLFGGLILGNSDGFTLVDGTKIAKQEVEKIQTFEIGYRAQAMDKKLFLDANAFYNINKDFLSPVKLLGVATHRGDELMSEVQDLYAAYNGLVLSYINFGEVNTYGFDLGATYYFNQNLSATVNYSYFDYSVDEDNKDNDFNADGYVDFLDVLVNAPKHKAGAGLNYTSKKWFGNVFARWVQSYNYFSSFQIASETLVREDGTPYMYRGLPIVEDARSGDTYNYGPLGGFVTVDLGLGYRINDMFTVSAAASNLFNQELREFTASAPTKGLYTLEFKVNLPALGKK